MIELLSNLYGYVKSGKSPLLEKSKHINKYENGTIYTMSLSLILWLRLEYKRTEWRKEKKYVTSLKEYEGNLLLVGINYDKKSKKHQCIIETLSALTS